MKHATTAGHAPANRDLGIPQDQIGLRKGRRIPEGISRTDPVRGRNVESKDGSLGFFFLGFEEKFIQRHLKRHRRADRGKTKPLHRQQTTDRRPQTEKATAVPPKAPPPVKKAPPAAAQGVVSSLEACWEALCKKHPDELREKVSERWFEILERVAPGKDQADFGPEDWGKVLADVDSDLPF